LSENSQEFRDLFSSHLAPKPSEIKIVLDGQYKKAYELLDDAISARLTPIIIGPPGVGKSLLARKFAYDTQRPFYELFFDELLSPTHLVGTFNPAILVNKGYCMESFEPGPLLLAMIKGGVFVAQEINRASEFCQNSFLEPLEEKTLYIPRLGKIRASDDFVFIAVANPYEFSGAHRISEALRDRLHVWINLTYPTKEVELKIISANCPEHKLSSDIMEKIYSLIAAARQSEEYSKLISVRTGISIARIASRYSEMDLLTDDVLVDIAYHTLLGTATERSSRWNETKLKNLLKGTLPCK